MNTAHLILLLLTTHLPAAKVVTPPKPNYVLPMRYTQPLTNCWMEIAADPKGPWYPDSNFTILTNGDWAVKMDSRVKFYRIAGEPL